MKRIIAAIFLLTATPAAAFDRVADRATFLTLLGGKTLSNRLYGVKLAVSGDGRIQGGAWGSQITGTWAWQNGFFCRGMMWGDTEIPYNCQLVEVRNGNEMRFTSDQGAGENASFMLR